MKEGATQELNKFAEPEHTQASGLNSHTQTQYKCDDMKVSKIKMKKRS